MKSSDELDKNTDRSKKSDLRVIRRTVLIFAVCVGAFAFLFSIDTVKNAVFWIFKILAPVLAGVILALVVNPINVAAEKFFNKLYEKHGDPERSEKHKRSSHLLGVTVAMLSLILFITLLLVLIIPEFLENLKIFAEKASDLISNGVNWIQSKKIGETQFFANFDKYITDFIESATAYITGQVPNAVSVVIGSIYDIAVFIVDFLISLVICAYALLEKKRFIAYGKKISYALFNTETANDILDTARYGNNVFGKFLYGKIITSTIVGVLTFIFMQIMRMPYPIIASVFVGVTNIIPYFGPFIGGIPTAFIILLNDVRQGIIYIIFTVILQQIEGNIIEPHIMEDKTGVSKFWVTFALLLCGGMFGLLGLIFAVPVFAVIFYALRKYVSRRLAAKNYPTDNASYYSVESVDPETGEFKMLPEPSETPKKRKPNKEKNKKYKNKNKNG